MRTDPKKQPQKRGVTPAFLTTTLVDVDTYLPQRRSPRWSPRTNTRSVLAALEAVPKLTASIGLAVATHPDATVEVLPGTPTTILFTAKGELRGMFVLPIKETEARSMLGLEPSAICDIETDRLWEEQRGDDVGEAAEPVCVICGDSVPSDEHRVHLLTHRPDAMHLTADELCASYFLAAS